MARACLAIALASISLCAPAAAQASFGIAPHSLKIEVLRPGGQPDLRAGGHPDRVKVSVGFNTTEGKSDGNVKDLEVALPAGFFGNGSAVPACPRSAFDGEECAPENQVGTMAIDAPGLENEVSVQIFNIEPAPGDAFELGAKLIAKFPLVAHLRRSDGGVTMALSDLVESIPISHVELELWGVPADHQSGTGLPRRPFLTLPTSCTPGGMAVAVRARSWQEPEVWDEDQAETGTPLEGCDLTPFGPGVALSLTDPLADSPTGVEVSVEAASNEDPDGRGSPPIKDMNVMLPEGMSVSPGGAGAVAACSESGFALGAEDLPVCPPTSKVGTAEIVSPVLRDPVAGTIYIGEEHPGERFRILVAANVGGAELKLAGALSPDPETGRLAFELHDLPRLPLSRMTLRFGGGSRALLATPLSCGVATASALFSAYDSGASTVADAEATIAGSDGACGGTLPFGPEVSVGVQKPRAGMDSALSMTLRRHDGEQLPERFRVSLPPGLTARLGTVETCTADGGAGECPAGSRIGSAVAEIGSGLAPAGVSGDVYLTGPRKGAPYGLDLAFHPRLGPFDLGGLAIRGAIRMDPSDGRIEIETDPLPQIIAGVPVRFQTIGLDIDRPGFIGNPTSCRPSSAETSVLAVDGRVSTTTTPFTVGGCDSQPFHPSPSLDILGKHLGEGATVGFRIGIRISSPTTNLRGVSIPLPAQLQFEPTRIEEVCARGAVLKGKCPPGSRVGRALARTPLLSEPLAGSVYVVQPPGKGLPDLWTVLEGQGLRVAVKTRLSSNHGRVTADLVKIPDFPLSALRMTLAGGDSGILTLREGLCAHASRRRLSSILGLEGQDGAFLRRRVSVAHRACQSARTARPMRRRDAGPNGKS